MESPNKTTQHNGMVLSQEGLLMDSCVIIEQVKHSPPPQVPYKKQ